METERESERPEVFISGSDDETRSLSSLSSSGSSASLPSPPFAVFSFSAGPELCDPGSSGAIAVWDKQ